MIIVSRISDKDAKSLCMPRSRYSRVDGLTKEDRLSSAIPEYGQGGCGKFRFGMLKEAILDAGSSGLIVLQCDTTLSDQRSDS